MRELDKAIHLRQQGNFEETNLLLIKLVEQFPEDAFVNYQCAWSFDILGKEAEAVPFYKKAIHKGLKGEDLEGALIGLGSTYRALGEYEKSKNIFQKGMELFPSNSVIQVFYSMTLYNLNETNKAMELLLKNLIETTIDDEILQYKNALLFYADKLNQVWK